MGNVQIAQPDLLSLLERHAHTHTHARARTYDDDCFDEQRQGRICPPTSHRDAVRCGAHCERGDFCNRSHREGWTRAGRLTGACENHHEGTSTSRLTARKQAGSSWACSATTFRRPWRTSARFALARWASERRASPFTTRARPSTASSPASRSKVATSRTAPES